MHARNARKGKIKGRNGIDTTWLKTCWEFSIRLQTGKGKGRVMTRVYRLKTQLAWKSPLIKVIFLLKRKIESEKQPGKFVLEIMESFLMLTKIKNQLGFYCGEISTNSVLREWVILYISNISGLHLTLNHQVNIAPQVVELIADRSKTRSWKKSNLE